VIIGGGLVVRAGGALVGPLAVSGAPGGDADEACAKQEESIQGKTRFLEFNVAVPGGPPAAILASEK